MILNLVASQHVLVYHVNFSKILPMSFLHTINLSKMQKHWGSFLTHYRRQNRTLMTDRLDPFLHVGT